MFERTANSEQRTANSERLLSIQRLDLLSPSFLDDFALDLERRRQLAGIDAELSRQQRHPFDPLVLGEFLVERVDEFLIKRDHIVSPDQLLSRRRGASAIRQPAFERI